WLRRRTLPRAHRLLVSSEALGRRLVAEFGVAPERIELFLGIVDTELHRPLERAAACREVGLDPGRRHLLFAGRLDDRVKRVGAPIAAFGPLSARHPDVDLVIRGDGPDRRELERRAAGAAPAGRVRFTGWVGAAEARVCLYNAAECLVLPSRSEGAPAV